jgi:hypothetical protein
MDGCGGEVNEGGLSGYAGVEPTIGDEIEIGLTPRLTVEFSDGSGVDEYRIRERQVEFRPRYRGGSVLPNAGSQWRQLTAEDISMHMALRTVVGEWLKLRFMKSAE